MTNSEDLTSSTTDCISSMKVSEVNISNGGGVGVVPLSYSNSTVMVNASPSLNVLVSTAPGNRKKSISCSLGDSEAAGGSYSVPFVTIRGEKVVQVVPTADGLLVLSNYRLYIQGKESHSHHNIPLGLVDQVEGRDIFYLLIHCKDARCIRCTFPNNESVVEAIRKIQLSLSVANKMLEESFAFTFYDKVEAIELCSEDDKLQLGFDLPPPATPRERFDAEIKRMEFNVQNPWRISFENEDFELCSSYPRHIIVPNSIDKKKLEQVACFRSARRFPAVVWRHRGNGAVICRCSQPEVGWFGWRSTEDEELVQNIIQACAYQSYDRFPHMGESQTVPLDSISSPSNYSGGSIEMVPEFTNTVKKLLILDARSYATAVANRARGGGCECLEYYPNCEIQFMNLANIHSIRKSFINVRQLCSLPSDQANWFSQLEGCKWLQHMSGLMKAAVTVVTAIENDGRPVMVHCSDGWDRTPQIVALAEILLDPYYRSLEGFEVLVEREWLDFGHKFGDRCGQGVGSEDSNERCPVFLQWLDCLHQLLRQFPTAFEFNMSFLVKLVQHTYSNLFGTFLCNTSKERELHEISGKTISVWRFLRAPRNYEKFRNSLYKSCDKVLWPSCEVRDLGLWSQVYLGYENPPPSLTEVVNPSQESSPAPSVAEGDALEGSFKSLGSKGRSSSYENLTQLCPSKGHQRKLSDSSIYGPQDNDTDSCVSKDLLMKALRDEDEEDGFSHPSSEVNHTASSPSNGSLPNQGHQDNSEEESEEHEGNSEDRSESTLGSTSEHKINLKSIDSSTDTLVPELGFSPETKQGRTNGEVTTMSESRTTLETDLTQLLAEEDLRMDNGNEDALSDIEISLLNSNLSNLAVETESGGHNMDIPTTEKLLPDMDMEDMNHFQGMDIGGHIHQGRCSVCEQSKAVLRHVQNHDNFPPPNPSAASTINFSSCNGTNGSTSSAQLLLKEKQNLDIDGLSYLHDETQIRLNSVLAECQAQIEALQRDVQIYRNALREQVCHGCLPCTNSAADVLDTADNVSSSVSYEAVSRSSSEVSSSFEAIDHADTYPPLWIPDFAVTHCMGCYVKFSLGRRKHHCRACGRVFCSDCSENSMALPHEQIFVPSRVCRSCFTKYQPDGQGHGGHPTDMMSNGGDGILQPNGTSGTGSSSAVTRPMSVPNTSVPSYPMPAVFNPHAIPGISSSHNFNHSSSSTNKSKLSKYTTTTARVPPDTANDQMNGYGRRVSSKPQ